MWYDFYWDINYSVDNLQDLFNVVYISNDFFEFFHHDHLFDIFLHFSYSFIFVSDFNDFRLLSDNFFDLLNDNRYFNNFLYDALNVSVYVN